MQTELFYNTIDLPDTTEQEIKCITQEEIILSVYKRWIVPLTAHEVFQITEMNCINSVRRAITNLYKKGLLIKTDIKRVGGFGQLNYAYRIK